MRSDPLVSIIIPVYNGGDYLREAIDSALEQTYRNTEVLVINDGSDDGGVTRKIAESCGESVRYYEKENGGVSSALNLGIRKMRGDLFSWLSHDDLYDPRKIEAQVRALQGTDSHSVVYCNYSTIDADSRPLADTKVFGQLRSSLSSREALHHVLRHGSLNGCGFLIPRAMFEECGGFAEDLRYKQDALMWYRMFAAGWSLTVVPEQLVKSRVHQNQQTQKNRGKFSGDNQKICSRILPAFEKISTPEDDFVLEYALRCSLSGENENVRQCIQALKKSGRFGVFTRTRLFLMRTYGLVRPAVRRVYYKLIRGIRTG